MSALTDAIVGFNAKLDTTIDTILGVNSTINTRASAVAANALAAQASEDAARESKEALDVALTTSPNSAALQVNLAAPTGSSLVGANDYQTQEDVNNERVSPLKYGAVGNGVANDTTAIQAAINSQTSALILDLCGLTFKINSSLTVTNPITIRNGALDVSAIDNIGYQAAGINLVSANNITIEEVKFIGRADSVLSKSSHGIGIDRNGGTGSSNIIIRNCVFDGVGSFGVTSNLIHGSKNWSITDNTFYLYGVNNQHPGVAAGIDLFSDQNIATAYNRDSFISGNNFIVTSGYGGVAYKVQGCINITVSDNHVNGGTVIDYSSGMVEMYATGQYINNTVTAGTNVPSFISLGSPYLDVRNCFFINCARTDVNSRAGGINNGNVNFHNTSVSYVTRNSDFLNGAITLNNCSFQNVIIQAVDSFTASKGTEMSTIYVQGGGTVQNISMLNSRAVNLNIAGGTSVSGLNISGSHLNKFYVSGSVTGFNVDNTTILDFNDTSTSFKTIRNCLLSITPGSYSTINIANAFCIGNTFYGQASALAGNYVVQLAANATLVNNKYTLRSMSGVAGTYTGYVKIPSTTANTVKVIETPESFIDGLRQYTVYDVAVNQATNIVDSAAPTTGTFTRGQIAYNTLPNAAGIPGWVCTSAGTPGTWKAMAVLAA